MDGVLVDSESVSGQIWVEVLAEHGLGFTVPDFMARSVGASLSALYAGLERDHAWTRPAGFDDAIDARLNAAFVLVRPVPGAPELLSALRLAGVPFAVASNSRRDRLDLKLRSAGLTELLQGHVYDPAQVGGRGKPEPDLYLHAARQLGADIQRCVVIEDSVPGLTAGHRAGASVWGFTGGDHAHDQMAAHLLAAGAARTVGSHAELRALLTGVAAGL